MVRNVGVVIGAMLLSGVLTGLMGAVVARSDDTRLMMQISADHQAGAPIGEDRAKALFAALERGHFRNTWIYSPAVALAVGMFAGLLARGAAWQLGLIGVAPFALMFAVGIHGFWPGIGILVVYMAAAALGAWATERLLHRIRAVPASRPTLG